MNFKENESAQKLRGGYYTPSDLARFIVQWVREIAPKRVLEPSCGDGAFFQALGDTQSFRRSTILGFEIDEHEASQARARASAHGLERATVRSADYLHWAIAAMDDASVQFDAIVGNPPFVRYQYLPAPFQVNSEAIFAKLKLPFTKHTNAWVPFVLSSIALLRPGGRLAMVVPAELIHVTHAQPLRSYLGRECRRIVVVDPEDLWFANTLQGAVIILAEKKLNQSDKGEGLAIYSVKGRAFARTDPSAIFAAPTPINGRTVEGKWTRALLDSKTRSLLDELTTNGDVKRFDAVANVDVGIVTGANKFFLVPDAVVEANGISKWAHPMFGRSEHCPGIIYDHSQHSENRSNGTPTNFLWFSDGAAISDPAVRKYVKSGESQGLHTRYKCRVRSPWYRVPSIYATEIGMLKRCHDTPRLIHNRLKAYTTDTAYRVRACAVDAQLLVGCFINPLTALSAELEGRHYGGGVLELIPSEIEKLLIPLPRKIHVDLSALDKHVRTLPAIDVLERQSKPILGSLGLTADQRLCLLEGWRKLRDRRHRISSEVAVAED